MQQSDQINKTDVPFVPDTMSISKRKAYFVGSGIASLAGAAFLLRDGHIPGEAIHIFEELKITGGSLDGTGTPEKGYVIRGGRMIEEHYVCTYDLFSSIPLLTETTPRMFLYFGVMAYSRIESAIT